MKGRKNAEEEWEDTDLAVTPLPRPPPAITPTTHSQPTLKCFLPQTIHLTLLTKRRPGDGRHTSLDLAIRTQPHERDTRMLHVHLFHLFFERL